MSPRRARAAAWALLAAVSVAAGASAQAPPSDTLGKTTVQQIVDGTSRDAGYGHTKLGAGRARVVREDKVGVAKAGRADRRRSLFYFGQMSDFQLADEESPARVEFAESAAEPPLPDTTSAAGRPQEAMNPHIDALAIRQMNAFATTSPVPDGGGGRGRMNMVITTGDSADNQQVNEVKWVVKLLEGGTLDPNSGSANPADYLACPPGTPGIAEARRYTGVQDYSDYVAGTVHYDPQHPLGKWAKFPLYNGLMDRAQAPFEVDGLKVPSYVAFGNHDGLVQGNAAATSPFDSVAVGCIKPMLPAPSGDPLSLLSPAYLSALAVSNPAGVLLTPPDPDRTFASRQQYKALHKTGRQADAHGFGYVDPAENAASKGSAGYYAWSPVPGVRFIALDTVAQVGIPGPGSEGNIDDPQFRWVERELKAATARDQLVVLFGHHPVRSLTTSQDDEQAPPCTGLTTRGHDLNPGCDYDPRSSRPIHLGQDLVALLHRYPHAIAYVAGHTHTNKITPFPDGKGGGFWGVETASETDFPQQSRLLDVMDNVDGTLSIFGTVLDTGAPSVAPRAGDASAFTPEQLASAGRELSFNDPQAGGPKGGKPGPHESTPADDNVELLVTDPRADANRYAKTIACRDRLSPRSTIARHTLRATGAGIAVAGVSRDRGCASAPGRAARVLVAVGREVAGGCRWLRADGRLAARRSCRKPAFLRALPRYSRARRLSAWTFRKRARLPKGQYELEVRGVDARGNTETFKRAQRVIKYFRVR